MKLQFKINLSFEDCFERKLFEEKKEIFGPKFRQEFLGYLGFLMRVDEEDKARVESFIIKRLPDSSEEDVDIKNDISGDAT